MFDKIRELILSFFTYLFGLLGMVFPTKLTETPETPETPEIPNTTWKDTPETPKAPKQETLIIDTERSVGFTGIDSVFGTNGEAELRESTEESDELKILGDLEELDMGEIEELDTAPAVPLPLSADDYESL